MDKYLNVLSDVAEKLIYVLTLLVITILMYCIVNDIEVTRNVLLLGSLSLLVILEISLLLQIRKNKLQQKSVAYKLEKLIEYDKKRKDIEEQMDYLSRQLVDSDMAKYVDINRLIFDGQSRIPSNNVISINSFLQQYGLDPSYLSVKKNTAVFLTPFTNQGTQLYRRCQNILGNIGIFLQRSDNVVEKDDILMNIVTLIVQSEIVVVNIDGRNPNVYYELGIAHTLGKTTILLSKRKGEYVNADFDIRQKKIVLYEDYDDLERKLLSEISLLKRQK